MLCNVCQKRPAKIYYTEIKNGEKKEQHLCEECAAEKTSFQMKSAGNGLDQMLGSFLSNILGNVYGEEQEKKETDRKIAIRCPVCKTTVSELQKNGKFGCANCYQAFGDTIDRSLSQIQGSNRHTGKQPINYETPLEVQVERMDEVEKYTKELQEAVEKEDYEEAAKLRDKIRELKGEKEWQDGTKNRENSAT